MKMKMEGSKRDIEALSKSPIQMRIKKGDMYEKNQKKNQRNNVSTH